MKAVKFGEQDILVANINGAYYAIGNSCTHEGGNLSKGKLEGNIVTCPKHKAQFDVTTGKIVGGPAAKDEPKFEIKIEGTGIKVNI